MKKKKLFRALLLLVIFIASIVISMKFFNIAIYVGILVLFILTSFQRIVLKIERYLDLGAFNKKVIKNMNSNLIRLLKYEYISDDEVNYIINENELNEKSSAILEDVLRYLKTTTYLNEDTRKKRIEIVSDLIRTYYAWIAK